MPSKTVAPLPSKSTRRIIRSAAPGSAAVIRRWQPARQDPTIERLRSAYDAQDRNTCNYVLDRAVDEEVRQAEAATADIVRHIAREGAEVTEHHGSGDLIDGPSHVTSVGTIWEMFDDSAREAHRAATAAQQGAYRGSRVVVPGTGALNTSPLNAFALNGSGFPDLGLMLQSAVTVGEKTDEGQTIEAVFHPWRQIVTALLRNPQLMHELDWRAWEEMIAGGYKAAGYDIVILTPPSGDRGRDIIATRDDLGSIRIIDQVKAYKPGHRVPANDVRALLGVLSGDQNVSKGIVTTTSEFAPGVYEDPFIKPFMPNRLDLRSGPQLLEWLRKARDRGL
jgi:restriction system protein